MVPTRPTARCARCVRRARRRHRERTSPPDECATRITRSMSACVDIGQHRTDAFVDGERHRVGRLARPAGQVDRERGPRQARDQPVPERARGAATMDEHEPEILHRGRSVTCRAKPRSGRVRRRARRGARDIDSARDRTILGQRRAAHDPGSCSTGAWPTTPTGEYLDVCGTKFTAAEVDDDGEPARQRACASSACVRATASPPSSRTRPRRCSPGGARSGAARSRCRSTPRTRASTSAISSPTPARGS